MAINLDPVSIEPMRAADLEDVSAIDRRCFPAPWLPTAFSTELNNRSAYYLVARAGRDMVGFGGAWVIMDEVHVTTLAVDPGYRRRGIGERLLIALLDKGLQSGAARSTLEVRAGNGAARALYRKYGYYEATVRRSYYTDNGEDAIVMWADGINRPEFRRWMCDRRSAIGDADQSP